MDKVQQANTILQQLGGRRFLTMTGAKNLVAHDDGLSFKLPSQPHYTRAGINYVRVKLTPADLYDVEYGRIWGINYKPKTSSEGLYAEDLCRDFSRTTGLDTHL